ncbi:MAG: hypothetical protein ACTSRP_00090 [Candidatus Helarchaeota archaeon]
MEIKLIIDKLKENSINEYELNEIFKFLESVSIKNPLIFTDYIKDFLYLLNNSSYQLYIIGLLEDLSIHHPEIFEGSIGNLLNCLKIQEIQLDILSILDNILEKDPHILIDDINHISKAINEPHNKKIKSELNDIYNELKYKFPDFILDPIESLIKEIENQDINIINVYENILTNYRDFIKNDVEFDIDPLELLVIFSEKSPEIFKDSIEYLINSLENEDIQLYSIEILKNIATKVPLYFENYISKLIRYLKKDEFQFEIIEILQEIAKIPRLLQSEISNLIEFLEIENIRLDLIRILRDISEINPTFFKNNIQKIINLLNINDISFRLNIWGILSNIVYEEPEMIKPYIPDLIKLLNNDDLYLETVDLLKNIGRRDPTLFKDYVKQLIDILDKERPDEDIIDIFLNISIRSPEILYEYDSIFLELLDNKEVSDEILDILVNILKAQPIEMFDKIINYLNYLDENSVIDNLYPEIKKYLQKGHSIIMKNTDLFVEFIINKYNKLNFRNNIEDLKNNYAKYNLIKSVLDETEQLILKLEPIITQLNPNKITHASQIILLIDYIINLKKFMNITEKYIDRIDLVNLKENRKMFYELLTTFKKGIAKITGKIHKKFK